MEIRIDRNVRLLLTAFSRSIHVDNETHVSNVDASGNNVGCQQYLKLIVSEVSEDFPSLLVAYFHPFSIVVDFVSCHNTKTDRLQILRIWV